jgi:Ran GTPase-activating protein (RanGAP) involved in mRNA processing and transport
MYLRMELGRFCALVISLVLTYDPEILQVLLMLSKAFTEAIKEFKAPMSLVNRIIETGCSRKMGKKILKMLKNLAFDGVRFLCLYRINMTGDNMLRFALLVRKVPYLLDLDLSRTGLTDAGVKLLVRVLMSLKFLKTLTLQENRITWPGVLELAKLSEKRENIEKLDLEGTPIFTEVNETPMAMYKVKELDLSDTGLKNEHMAMLVEHQKRAEVPLKDLRAVRNALTAEGGFHAAALIMLGLKCLSIADNKVGDEGAKHIAKALKDSKLEGLHMSMNEIGDDGAEALAVGIGESRTIRYVTLHYNNFSEEGAQVLEASEEGHVSLRLLYV